ncbi:MAG: bifunctional 4-hydroxy-3-methylbut-2-enyl diphosphate reductase/30S ribosomal protein S1 [Oscillospiraceae bacterium]|nr:bifunctional 4-hydroxy-3-methylbut-2-enyl diphosphate reductase/30S ribosomal protein S1 [Oscillospiraceae bacterium]
MMKIRIAKSAGFCFGVERAVELAEGFEGRCCTLGEIIHNRSVTDKLAASGVRIINSPEQAEGGETVIIRSHGVGRDVYDRLDSCGVPYLDGTCPFVKRIQRIVSECTEKGMDVVIVGDSEHPEVIGIAGHGGENVSVVPDIAALEMYLKKNCEKLQKSVAIMPQTTYNISNWQKCRELACRFPGTVVYDTVCRATSDRQSEAAQLAADSDVMIVLGGHNSSNTRKLYEICRERCAHTYCAEDMNELEMMIPQGIFHKGDAVIGITAGASTPAYIIKEVVTHMSEKFNMDEDFNFEEELEASFKRIYTGNRVKGTVIAVNNTEATVDLGTKQSGYVALSELTDNPALKPEDVVKVGEEYDFIVTKVNDAEGTVQLSKKKIDAMKGFDDIIKAKESGEILEGTVTAVVKGGVTILYNGVRVFIPKSQATARKDDKLEPLVKTVQKFKVIEVNEQRNRAVGSIRQVLSAERDAAKAKFWESAKVGDVFKGEVKSLTSYGAFVDLGGIDGMVHISELSWDRIRHPSEVVNVGDMLEVYIKELDPEKDRISLGYKKTEDDPWVKFENEYSVGDTVTGKVVSITPFGAFVRIMPGIDGLVHISQLADRKVSDVKEVVSVGDEVTAKITDADIEKKRISLSIRALSEAEGEDEE